jgi:hypothetical protein
VGLPGGIFAFQPSLPPNPFLFSFCPSRGKGTTYWPSRALQEVSDLLLVCDVHPSLHGNRRQRAEEMLEPGPGHRMPSPGRSLCLACCVERYRDQEKRGLSESVVKAWTRTQKSQLPVGVHTCSLPDRQREYGAIRFMVVPSNLHTSLCLSSTMYHSYLVSSLLKFLHILPSDRRIKARLP